MPEIGSVPGSMVAMRMHQARGPLSRDTVSLPEPGPRRVLLRVRARGVCRTDLHIVDGELAGGRRRSARK